jgi:hypothetical protein
LTRGGGCTLARDRAAFPGQPGARLSRPSRRHEPALVVLRTTTPEAFNSLMSGLEERVFGRLPDETWVYPGHGNDTTLGAERPHLEEWRARGW